jgi:hypothetical protein
MLSKFPNLSAPQMQVLGADWDGLVQLLLEAASHSLQEPIHVSRHPALSAAGVVARQSAIRVQPPLASCVVMPQVRADCSNDREAPAVMHTKS